MRRILGIVVFSFAILCIPPDASAFRVDRAAYRYPYRDPYLATTTLSITRGRAALWSHDTVSRRSLEITVLEGRDNVYLLRGQGKLRFRFYQQKGSAPLIFIIPGLGGPAASGSATYLAEVLVGEGFHVLILPSPFNWNFALAASRSGLPGLTEEDSRDLYAAMQLALEHVGERYGARIGRTGLIGLSDGAIYAPYISKLDAEGQRIGIRTYLLVNPPVNLMQAVEKIDQMAQIGRKFGRRQGRRIEAYAVGVAAQAGAEVSDAHDPFVDPEYFSDWDKRFRLTGEQIRFLIGKELQSPIGDVIYVRELMQPGGVLKTPVSCFYRTERLYEAHSHGLMDYVRLFLIPELQKRGGIAARPGASMVRLSLKDVEDTLFENKNIFVMHNLNDFLVSRADLDYLEELLGDRAKFYPYGGHMGNIWYWQNRKDIIDFFSSLYHVR
ncbi:MAG: alpha/beta hydrolase [Pseudomonadota bacterium]|nr:alpha/beta hydrolase [Pseudomonadota bacterium]